MRKQKNNKSKLLSIFSDKLSKDLTISNLRIKKGNLQIASEIISFLISEFKRTNVEPYIIFKAIRKELILRYKKRMKVKKKTRIQKKKYFDYLNNELDKLYMYLGLDYKEKIAQEYKQALRELKTRQIK
jgi:7-keto-8-aminopelargonate synthetase-like enzyme